MSYVLKHKQSSEIYACTLMNNYDIPYHGAKAWEDAQEAEEQQAGYLRERGETPEDWELLEVDEHQMKMFNVKLSNNPKRQLFLNEDGRPLTKPRES